MEPNETAPQPEPGPVVSAGPIVCPSCGSTYDAEGTHELTNDTGLPARIRDLESHIATYREGLKESNESLERLRARLAEYEANPPRPYRKERDFIVGQR